LIGPDAGAPTRQLRTLAGMGALVPLGVGALGLGLLTRSRRRGVNFLMANWPPLLLAANGVQLNVVGKDNLTAQRPAVFIFNHRNNFDPMIAAALVRDDWTGVGKKELESDPLAGRLGRLMDAVYIDRNDPAAAVESLHKIEELAAKGLSVLIAPEGTRHDAIGVGPFKKGPFRIAMAAGIPIVPVVIRNAEEIAARNSSTINAGTVDVAVFPPMEVTDWTLTNLSDRIAEVRQLYLDTLMNWPVDTLPQPALYRRPTHGKAQAKRRPKVVSAPPRESAQDAVDPNTGNSGEKPSGNGSP
jgi:putative phosphoserine phosphatase / 1-acylglycerol-3-phosphate O-acyltransferase